MYAAFCNSFAGTRADEKSECKKRRGHAEQARHREETSASDTKVGNEDETTTLQTKSQNKSDDFT